MEPYLGQIILWAGNFAPRGFAFCNGQLLPIAQNQALFAILGTTYGGNGVQNFALPDLRGRLPVHAGASAGPGLPQVVLGEIFGSAATTLTIANLAPHMHFPMPTAPGSPITAGIAVTNADDQDDSNPVGNYLAKTANANYAGTSNGVMGIVNANVTVQASGQNQPVNTTGPTLALNYCIALTGIFPSRN